MLLEADATLPQQVAVLVVLVGWHMVADQEVVEEVKMAVAPRAAVSG